MINELNHILKAIHLTKFRLKIRLNCLTKIFFNNFNIKKLKNIIQKYFKINKSY